MWCHRCKNFKFERPLPVGIIQKFVVYYISYFLFLFGVRLLHATSDDQMCNKWCVLLATKVCFSNFFVYQAPEGLNEYPKSITQTSLQPGLSFRAGRFSLEESRGTKSESVFRTLCYHNQMHGECMQEKIEFSCTLQRPRLISTKI